jgi:hypothetical protein
VRRAPLAIIYIAALIAFAVAAFDAARLAWADLLGARNTPDSVARAVRLDPANATLHGLLAEHLEAAGQDPKPELRAAIALSPRESRYWSRLAFREETEQDDGNAEKDLLKAAETDRMYAPRWSLANFYLRRGDARRGDIDRFWQWLQKSAEMSPGDLGGIFQVAWAVTQDGAKIRSILPPDRAVLRQYVAWLAVNRSVADAKQPALELAKEAEPGDVAALFPYVDRAIPVDLPGALQAWNAMCEHQALACAPLDPAAGPVITNGTFSSPPIGRGFDWTLLRQPGTSEAMEEGGGLAIQFSGKQADTGLLLQLIPVTTKTYRLSFEYRVSGSGGPTGLRWEILRNGRNLLDGVQQWRATDWKIGQIEFRSDAEAALRLMLVYGRETGMVPWQGTLYLRKISIEALQ